MLEGLPALICCKKPEGSFYHFESCLRTRTGKGTAGQFSGKLKHRKGSVSGKFQRDPYFGLEIDESSGLTESTTSMPDMLTFLRQWPYFDWMKIIFSVIEIQVEALYFYAPVINDERKCFDMHQQFLENAFVLGFFLIGIHMVIFLSYKKPLGLVINFLIYYSILAMAAIILLEKQGYPIFFDPMKYFKILLCIRYLARIISIYSLFSKAVRSSTELSEAKWVKIAVNLYLYLQAANVFGGLWYFMAIERVTECWTKACVNHTGQHCHFSCRVNLEEDRTYINGFCPTKMRNTTIHDFGIFHGALESGIVEGTSILQKLLHCFVWGLQNLSNLGHSLQSGSDVWENIFVILVVSSGLLLFVLLIGNMQIYLQSRTVSLKEMTMKPREVEEWKPFQKLSVSLQQEVKKYKPYIRRKTNHIDVENLLNNISKELGKKIKRELCWHLLKKVHGFMMLKEETLNAICDCVKPTFFTEHTHIIREGDPIDELIFVMQGKLRTYTFNDITSSSTRKKDHLEDSDFYGAELVDWALRDCSSFEFSKSTRTIEALTNVEAFTLMAHDLKTVFNDMRNRAAWVIQLAWRHYTRRESRSPTRRSLPPPIPLPDKVQEKMPQTRGEVKAKINRGSRFPKRRSPPLPIPLRDKAQEKMPQTRGEVKAKINRESGFPKRRSPPPPIPLRDKVQEKMPQTRGEVKAKIFQNPSQRFPEMEKPSGELRYRKGPISGKFQRDLYSALEIDESSGPTEFPTSNVKRSLYEMKNVFLHWPYFGWMQIILFVIVISVDPLFFYLPVINNVKKCLDLHDQLTDIANVLISPVIYVLIIVYVTLARHLMQNSHKNQWGFIIFDFLILLPKSQMGGTLLIEAMGGPNFVDSMESFIHVVFIQYVARIVRIYALFSTAIRSLSEHAKATWARFAFNLFLYLQAANVFGGLWYFMAIEREAECWMRACRNHTGRSHCSFKCHDNLEDYAFLNEFCPTRTPNMTIHDFGIFHGALESGIVEGKNFLHKFLRCFIWGLQNLSNLGRNLQTSSGFQENIFVILVVSSGFLLFALLVGNMQKYLKFRTVGVKEMTLKPREIEEWEPFQKLSKDLQQKVKKYKSYIQRKTDYIDVETLLNNLPKELRRNIKRELCRHLLSVITDEYVFLTRKPFDVIMDHLCDCVKPTFLTEHTHFLREGDPIDEMMFIVQGKLCTYTLKDIQSGSTSSEHKRYDGKYTRDDLLQDGGICGAEAYHRVWPEDCSFDIPKSNRTIQALTNVEAFTVMADDLKTVLKNLLDSATEVSMTNKNLQKSPLGN